MKRKLKSISYIAVPFFCLIILFYLFIGLLIGTIPFTVMVFEETVIVEKTKLEITTMGTIFSIKCNSTIKTDYIKIRSTALTRTSIVNGTILVIEWEKYTVYLLPCFQPQIRYRKVLITIIL